MTRKPWNPDPQAFAAEMAAARQERARVVEDALAAVITEIIETVPLSDEARERITELMRGGDAVQRPLIGDR